MHTATIDQLRFVPETTDATAGVHLCADLWECDRSIVMDKRFLQSLALEAAQRAGATVCEIVAVNFAPRTQTGLAGITVAAVLSESHLTIHTYPETGYVAVDIFTCGATCDPHKGYACIKEKLAPRRDSVTVVLRGNPKHALCTAG